MTADAGHPSSDSTAGYVVACSGTRVLLRVPDGRTAELRLTPTTHAQLLRNLADPYQDVSSRITEYLRPGAFVFAYGPVYPDESGVRRQISQLLFVGDEAEPFAFERPGWWIEQLRRLARFYRAAQFGDGAVDFADYRTELRSTGHKTTGHVQETDTISRMVYGMASAYMLTGEEDFLEVAERGSHYLREHMRFVDPAEDLVYWYHGIEVEPGRERKLFASEFDDDYRSIPAYEQIYALVGLTQTYRVTGDPLLLADIEATVRLFDRFFADEKLGGYFSHVDPVHMDPRHESLGRNRARKNWNSVGDHAPAYLINLYLATGRSEYRDMLERTFDMIATHLPDRTEQPSPFVFERFHGDWTPDRDWGWQQDRAVVGHNLKIAWNLTRFGWITPKPEYRALAARIAATMPEVGRDGWRGGWYDIVERTAVGGRHEFPWHDRKVWWQQEQAILAYLILAGATGSDEYLTHFREAAAFYNGYFLDHDEGAVHPVVLAQGLPFAVGHERLKGSHAMSMYHKAELCFLAETYTRLLVRREPLDLWFRPGPQADFPDRVLRVAPDALPHGVRLEKVRIDGEPWSKFDPLNLSVELPDSASPVTVQVRLRPVED
jgi:mannose/cellobiose epimerase-like protein (N-acyl-D-glucosamine 2-epimerase family)